MNLKQLAKLVGRSVRVWPIPQILPGGHELEPNCWQVSKPPGSRYYRLQLVGSSAAFALEPALMEHYWVMGWIILRGQMTITGVKIDFTPLPWGQAAQQFREHEQARFRAAQQVRERWNTTWAVWIQPGVVAGGMPMTENAVPGSDGL